MSNPIIGIEYDSASQGKTTLTTGGWGYWLLLRMLLRRVLLQQLSKDGRTRVPLGATGVPTVRRRIQTGKVSATGTNDFREEETSDRDYASNLPTQG